MKISVIIPARDTAFLIALAIRLAFLGAWVWLGLDHVYGRDLYYSLAQSWLGWTPPWPMDATHPPLYTAFIALVLAVFGRPNFLPILCLQALLSAAVCPLAFWVGARLASERTGRLAAFWIALDPALIFYVPQLQTETLFIFMEVLFFFCFYRLLEQESAEREWGWLGLGLLGGLASLCRSAFAAYPMFLLPAFWRMKGLRKIVVPGLLFSIGWLTPIGAWTARNWLRYHEIVPISAQMGWNLYEGFSTNREEIRRRPYEMAEEVAHLGISDPIAKSNYFKEKTFRFIKAHLSESVRIISVKAILYWRPWPYDPHPLAIRILLTLYFLGLFALAGYGVWVTRLRSIPWYPIYALFVYLTAMHSVFFTSLHYRLPLEPFLCLLAAAGLDQILCRSQSDKSALASGSRS